MRATPNLETEHSASIWAAACPHGVFIRSDSTRADKFNGLNALVRAALSNSILSAERGVALCFKTGASACTKGRPVVLQHNT